MTRLREVLGEAEAFVGRMPTEKAGLPILFIRQIRAFMYNIYEKILLLL
jgi:hypothetical protein